MKKIIMILSVSVLFACNQAANKTQENSKEHQEKSNGCCINSEYSAQATLWFQHSPEMEALYLQSYRMAKNTLAYNLQHKTEPRKKNAVVVDIDETILNNSPYQGWLYLNNQVYSDSSWTAWVQDAKAEPLPGTIDFLNYAKKKWLRNFLHFKPETGCTV